MYEPYFNLQRRPFSTTPDPTCVCRTETVQTVIDELVVCLERGEGIAVLTAPAGLGKTLLCEKVKQELGSGFVTILLRHADFSTPSDLLRTLMMELGKSPGADNEQSQRLELLGALSELRKQEKALAIICDEAHQLPEAVLEELRRLVDHADHGVPWVRLMLAGQLELEEKLAGPELSALNQRLRSHSTLPSLSLQESIDYIDYRLTWAGGRIDEIFHPDALSAIAAAADGNPRCLNHLCDHVLLLAYVSEQTPAPRELVDEALIDLQHLPLTWNVRSVRSSAPTVSKPVEEATPAAGATVEFGDHLATWERQPTLVAPHTVNEDGVWEFVDQPAETAVDPFENLLQAVETELDRVEAMRQADLAETPQVREEPVIDRYAAIDAGWPVENLPAEVVEMVAPESPRAAATSPMPMQPPVEEQMQSDVLELVTATRNAINQRFDVGQPIRPPVDRDEQMTAMETAPPPTIHPGRPFRNLFTRLRRKQQGLD